MSSRPRHILESVDSCIPTDLSVYILCNCFACRQGGKE